MFQQLRLPLFGGVLVLLDFVAQHSRDPQPVEARPPLFLRRVRGKVQQQPVARRLGKIVVPLEADELPHGHTVCDFWFMGISERQLDQLAQHFPLFAQGCQRLLDAGYFLIRHPRIPRGDKVLDNFFRVDEPLRVGLEQRHGLVVVVKHFGFARDQHIWIVGLHLPFNVAGNPRSRHLFVGRPGLRLVVTNATKVAAHREAQARAHLVIDGRAPSFVVVFGLAGVLASPKRVRHAVLARLARGLAHLLQQPRRAVGQLFVSAQRLRREERPAVHRRVAAHQLLRVAGPHGGVGAGRGNAHVDELRRVLRALRIRGTSGSRVLIDAVRAHDHQRRRVAKERVFGDREQLRLGVRR